MKIKDIVVNILHGGQKKHIQPLVTKRNAGSHAAVVFVHGFHGEAVETWASFHKQFLIDYRLNDWDIYSVGYATNLSVDLPIWTSDPDISSCAKGLVTKLGLAPLERYKAITLVAHSMGGLVVQKAILDSADLRERLSHVMLYGTPSAGVSKAALGSRIKRQAREMREGSAFIAKIREEWQGTIGTQPSFTFISIAGEDDAFIPASSSLDPFPSSQQAVVPGNHLEIVRPDSTNHYSYVLFYKILTGARGDHSVIESARLAVEHNQFYRAIELLMQKQDGLDDSGIVTLALALESVGRGEEAMTVIGKWNRNHECRTLDPIGVLAGRLKRRWLVSHQQHDFDRALELYSEGLERAETNVDSSQAYYHAINVAFLLLMATTEVGSVTSEIETMARRTLNHVENSRENHWTYATKGEASLLLGDLESGVVAYQRARELATKLRECDSMHMQAVAVALRVFGEDGARQIDEVFGLS